MVMTEQRAPSAGVCRSCNAAIEWRDTPAGKRAPFNLDGSSHFQTCPQSDQWKGQGRQPAAQQQPAVQAAPGAYESSDRSREIRRQVAIKTAAELVAAFAPIKAGTDNEVKAGDIFPLADKILAWLERSDS